MTKLTRTEITNIVRVGGEDDRLRILERMSRLDDTVGHRQTFVAEDNSAQLLTVYLQHHNCRSAHPAHAHPHTQTHTFRHV